MLVLSGLCNNKLMLTCPTSKTKAVVLSKYFPITSIEYIIGAQKKTKGYITEVLKQQQHFVQQQNIKLWQHLTAKTTTERVCPKTLDTIATTNTTTFAS